MASRLAWVTSRQARGWDPDESLAVPTLQAAGLTVDLVEWDEAAVDWASYDRAVIRSTWDYTGRLPEFLNWLEAVDRVTDLRNPMPLIRWSLDKHYLADLAAAGVPITPTTFAEPGAAAVPLPAGGVVVKPAVGAGARDAAAYSEDKVEHARAHAQRLQRDGRAVLVQPLLASVAAEGEWPLVFFDGRYSHAANRRVTLPRDTSVRDAVAAHDADAAQVAVAQAAIDLVTARFGAPTYARVDLVRGDDGQFCALELETAEPALFLSYGGRAAVAQLVEAFRP